MDLRRVSRAVRALRIRRGWRQADLAREAKLSRSVVGRIERGQRAGLTLDSVEAVGTALGATVSLELRWQGEGLDRLLDEGRATLVDRVVAWLRALGWEVAVEVSFARGGERGSIDVLAWHPVRRALIVIEVKSVTPDMQAMLYGLDRKARLGPDLARSRGWDARATAKLLVLPAVAGVARRQRGAANGPPAGPMTTGTALRSTPGTNGRNAGKRTIG